MSFYINFDFLKYCIDWLLFFFFDYWVFLCLFKFCPQGLSLSLFTQIPDLDKAEEINLSESRCKNEQTNKKQETNKQENPKQWQHRWENFFIN